MNNLILAMIAVAFSVALIFAGVNYMNAGSAARIKLVAATTADIEQMTGDYENLKVSLGRAPTGADFQQVYAGTSQNGRYNYTTDPAHNVVLATKAASIPGVLPTGSGINAPGWTYLPAAQTGFKGDYFCIKVSSGGASGKLAYEAAKTTAQKEMQGAHRSQISYSPNGCAGVVNVDPANWPSADKIPATYFLTFGSEL